MFGHVCPFVGVTMSDDSLLEYSQKVVILMKT